MVWILIQFDKKKVCCCHFKVSLLHQDEFEINTENNVLIHCKDNIILRVMKCTLSIRKRDCTVYCKLTIIRKNFIFANIYKFDPSQI